MDYDQAREIIQMKLREDVMSDVIEGVNISSATFYRWRDSKVQKPRLEVFVKFCIYYNIDIDINELKELL